MRQFSDAAIAYLAQRFVRTFAPFALVPFNFVGPAVDRARMSGGQIRVGITGSQGGSIAMTHDLARVPVGVMLLDNGALAQTQLQVSARSSTAVTVVPLTAALSAGSVLFIF